jgi:MFS family permease
MTATSLPPDEAVLPPDETLLPTPPRGRVRSAFDTHLGGLPRSFWILFGGQLVNRVGGMVLAFLVYYLSARGLSAGQIGTVMAALGVGAMVSQPTGGWLADRVGRRFTLVTGMVATAVALMFLGTVHGLALLLTGAALLGLVGDLYRPASAALVADLVTNPVLRAKAYGMLFWAVNLGFAIASVMAGFLADHGYWLLFAIDGGTGVLFAVIVYLGIPRDPVKVSRNTADGVGYRSALKDRLLVTLVLLTLGYAILYTQAHIAIPLAMRDSGLKPSMYGLMAAINGVLIVLLQPLFSTWLARFKRLHVLAGSWALVGFGMALTGFADTPWQYGLTVAVWTVGEVGTAGFVATLVSDLAPPGARGRYQGMFGWSWSASALIGPAVGATVYGLSPTALWWGCLVLGLACAAGAIALTPVTERRRSLALEG